MELKAITQKTSEKVWTDESGNQVQVERLSGSEKLMERVSDKIIRDAVRLHNELLDFKIKVRKACEDVYNAYYAERNLTPKGRGNFTFYNFNRTIKIEVSVNDRIEFDALGITTGKQLLDEYISENISTKHDMIKQLIIDAFSTTRGKIDSKKIINLIRYRSKINDEKFTRAVDLLEQSIRKPDSRMYFRVWQREPGGQWKNVDLNFSSIV